MLSNIPAEMKMYSQFVLWRYEEKEGKKATKVPYSFRGSKASSTDSETWCDFSTAEKTLSDFGDHFDGIGFVLTENDPFAFIDLDDPFDPEKIVSEAERQEILNRQMKVMEMFDTYSERSPSGKGLHIICKGKVAQGRKRSQIEVYSNQRFMTMTGDTFRQTEIKDCDELLNVLWSEMGKDVKVYSVQGDQPETRTDVEICDAAYNASNGPKFLDLYQGNWQLYYQSQSDADFALIDIIAFYTQNRAQIARIFRASGLGQRDKAYREDYVNSMVNRSFDHMIPPIDIEGLKIQIEAALLAKRLAEEQKQEQQGSGTYAEDSNTQSSDTGEWVPNTDFQQYTKVAEVVETPKIPIVRNKDRRYPNPPGLMGKIASFIEASAIRPVPEIALAASIALLSGICARAYNVSGTGLNQYTLLIAPTGTGKEAAHSGIDKLMTAVARNVPNSESFIGPGLIASEQALAKQFHRHSKSFLAMTGEVGVWLQNVCSPNASPAHAGIQRAFLELYNKSGKGSVYKPMINSDKEKSTDKTMAPGFSFFGESTPEKFYTVLDESMISSGMLPRFSVVEYRGKRPRKNNNAADVQPDHELLREMEVLCTNALALNQTDTVIDVRYTNDALQLLEDWDEYCDNEINSTDTESGEIKKQLWNRGHMRVLKLAALIAVGENAYFPTITYQAALWSINVVNDDIRNMISRYENGDFGTDANENKQMTEAIRVIRDYLMRPYSQIESYNVSEILHSERVIPYSYMSQRLMRLQAFDDKKAGISNSVRRAVINLVERGDIREVPRGELASKYKTNVKAYMVTCLRTFGL